MIDLKRLASLLEETKVSHQGMAFAALKEAHALVATDGKSWAQVFEMTCTVEIKAASVSACMPKAVESMPETKLEEIQEPKFQTTETAKILTNLMHSEKLPERYRPFINSLNAQYGRTGFLTPKQFAALMRFSNGYGQ